MFEKTASRHCGETTRLIHGKQVFIFMEDGINKRHIRLDPRRTAPQKQLAVFQDNIGFDPPAVDKNPPGLKPAPPIGQ